MAIPRRANIRFQYFEACCLEGDQKTEQLFPLELWIDQMEKTPLERRIREEIGIKGRLDDIGLTTPSEYYGLNFMRMDEISDAYKVKENAQAEHIDLAPDEYMGRSTAAIYDSARHILMIQRNRGGYGVSSIQTYINSTSEVGLCYLRPIFNMLQVEACIHNRVARVDVRFANIRGFRAGESETFERIVDAMNETEGITAHIEIGMGYARNESLNRDTICQIVEDVRNNRDNISSAKIVLDDDVKTAIFDLFENAEGDNIIFTLPTRGELGFEVRINDMDGKYTTSRARIVRALIQR